MSDYGYDYDDPPRTRKSQRTRPATDRDPEYVRETTYIQRGTGQPSRELVFRGREDSAEEIPRDFPPPGSDSRKSRYRDDYPPPRRARSVGRRDYEYDDDYSEYSAAPAAAAGAAGGYAAARAVRGGRGRGRDRYDDGYYTDEYEKPRRERRKSKVGEALAGLGLGGVATQIARARSKSRTRGRRDSSSDDSRGGKDKSDNAHKWQQAAKAAVLAGATEAFRSRKEPGGWTGPKGQRIATAALGAAGIDGFLDRNPGEKSKRHLVESVIGGLAANRIANGPRERSGSRGRSVSRSRSRGPGRSRSRSIFRSLSRRGRGGSDEDSEGGRNKSRGRGLKELAAVGGVAAAGKAIYDRVRSKSRKRRSPSASSEDSYVPERRQKYQRGRDGPDDDSEDDQQVARPRGRDAAERQENADEGRKREESQSSVSTTDLENQRKKSRGKELLTAGFATVATIHAAHGVYSSMKASESRHKLVMEGEMSPEEARKRKSKNMLQDAAAVGIAALGIKSAFGEWKEMNEQRHSVHELEEKRRKRRKAKEKRDKERRNNGGGQQGGGGQGFQNGGANYAYPAPVAYPVYADANPYSNVPPPPMGYR